MRFSVYVFQVVKELVAIAEAMTRQSLVSRALRLILRGVDGGAREDRTPDLLRARQALSQLSYGP
jgi:hypothetical protein